jgi:hypothetical protein
VREVLIGADTVVLCDLSDDSNRDPTFAAVKPRAAINAQTLDPNLA